MRVCVCACVVHTQRATTESAVDALLRVSVCACACVACARVRVCACAWGQLGREADVDDLERSAVELQAGHLVDVHT